MRQLHGGKFSRYREEWEPRILTGEVTIFTVLRAIGGSAATSCKFR